MIWYVRIIAQPKEDCPRSVYFPRRFLYKKDADALADEINRKDGIAQVVCVSFPFTSRREK